ncbi:sugar transferase [Priestia aryabhattai]|uniref:sugar transferase n=1 Tax=Priestia aryabhattai TaxID=412384 RepID=UPI002E219527|nr:sugar transferase [Priestia aryabhattai]
MRNIAEQSIPCIQPAIEKELSSQHQYEKWKRFFDFCGALIGIACLSWLFIIVAILIKLEDPKGRVFFSQTRIGRNGAEFKMYKFRSMVHDAEAKLEALLKYNEVSGAMFKMKEDPRITKIGKFIRKTSIDELPQLFNVLKGDMSLVGPRPPLKREVELYTPYQMQRLLILPGCTGLWQCTDRNSVGFEEMVELDLKYIVNRSLKMDLWIIVMTIKVICSNSNAY